MDYYIVDSVKGGCGKTTIAMYKAIELANLNPKNKVCYLDMDILGTAVEKFLGITSNPEVGVKYFSDMFENRESIRSEHCVRKLLFNKNDFSVNNKSDNIIDPTVNIENCIEVGAVFSSPDENKKNMFKPSISTHYNQHIDYDFFARTLEILFDELKTGKYTHMVIDMPPNSDAYTDSVFKLLLDFKKKDKVYLYLVSTYDRSHVEANLEWLDKMLKSKDIRWLNFEEIDIIFNDNRNLRRTHSDELDGAIMQIMSIYDEHHFPSKAIIKKRKCDFSDTVSLRAVFDDDISILKSMTSATETEDKRKRISFKEIGITDLSEG